MQKIHFKAKSTLNHLLLTESDIETIYLDHNSTECFADDENIPLNASTVDLYDMTPRLCMAICFGGNNTYSLIKVSDIYYKYICLKGIIKLIEIYFYNIIMVTFLEAFQMCMPK